MWDIKENLINTNVREDGTLEIYCGDMILCTISDCSSRDEKFIEDVLEGLGYRWNEDGTISELSMEDQK